MLNNVFNVRTADGMGNYFINSMFRSAKGDEVTWPWCRGG